MRLGIFGGTFDPPHVGHLLAASDAFEALALDRLVFVPAATQPLKAGRETAPAGQRLEMLALLVAGDPRFEVDPIEIARTGLSYSVDTLESFAARYAAAERFFLVGADIIDTFDRWREPERVLELAQLVILQRAADGSIGRPAAEVEEWAAGWGRRGGGIRAPRVLPTRRVDVSSTEVRSRVRDGKSVHGFVPDAVAEYIARGGLYR